MKKHYSHSTSEYRCENKLSLQILQCISITIRACYIYLSAKTSRLIKLHRAAKFHEYRFRGVEESWMGKRKHV